MIGIVVDEVPSVVGGASNEGLDEVDAEEAEQVDEGSDEGNNGGDFREGDDVEGSGGSDLVAPAVEEVVSDGEEEGEEDGVGEIERQWESVRRFGGRWGWWRRALVVVVVFGIGR